MKALLWKGERALAYQELSIPSPGEEELAVDVELAGICGSDLHPYRGHAGPRIPPLVLGHEAVVRVGTDRYVLYPLIGCGTCDRCAAGEVNLCAHWQLIGMHRQGVFAEQVVIPRSTLVPVPGEMPSERAVLTEPLACAVGAVRPERLTTETDVLVLGCGPIGLLSVLVAARRGATVAAIDPLDSRRELAARLGAVRTAAAAEDLDDYESDLVIDAAGFEATWRTSLDLVRSGGEVVVLGLGAAEGTFPMATLVRRGITMRGHFAYSRAEFTSALAILEDAAIDFSWVSVDSLSSGARAFAQLVDEPRRYVKIVLAPDDERGQLGDDVRESSNPFGSGHSRV